MSVKYITFTQIPGLTLEQAPHFAMGEVFCNCGCGQDIIIPQLVWLLEGTRFLYGASIPISSWNRCVAHNAAIGGADGSSHEFGYAVDIPFATSHQRFHLVWAAYQAGFPIIKLAPNHIHLDVNPDKPWGRLIL